MTKISVIIVIVFAICHLPRFVPNLFEIFTNKNENMPKVLIFVVSVSKKFYTQIYMCRMKELTFILLKVIYGSTV